MKCATANHVTYSAFGELASESDPTKTPFFAYTGRDWDEDLQLQYHRHRWYEPATGRWLSEDPIRFAAGDVNLQRYVGNDPGNYIDPTGQDGEANNRLPSDERGVWLKTQDRNRLDCRPAKRGEGWFHFNDKTLKPIKYVNGRPDFEASGLTAKHGGKPVRVNIGPLEDLGDDALNRQDHFRRADAEMRKIDPKWKRPDGYTWHHSSTDGTLELVRTAEHDAATHTGAIADQKVRMKGDTDSPSCAKNNKKQNGRLPEAATTPSSKPSSPNASQPHPSGGGSSGLRQMGRANMILDFLRFPLDFWRISREAEANGRTFDEQVDFEIRNSEMIMPGMPNPYYDYRNNPI